MPFCLTNFLQKSRDKQGVLDPRDSLTHCLHGNTAATGRGIRNHIKFGSIQVYGKRDK